LFGKILASQDEPGVSGFLKILVDSLTRWEEFLMHYPFGAKEINITTVFIFDLNISSFFGWAEPGSFPVF
jgi:hypothetical protein